MTTTVVALRGRLFCTVPEAAQVLELDPRTLRRAIEAGDFPAVRVHGTVRVAVAHLLTLAGLEDEVTDDSPGARLWARGASRGDAR